MTEEADTEERPESDPEAESADGSAESGDSDGPAETGKSEHGSFWRELPFLVLIALVLALLIKTFLVQAFYIPSASMETTLQGGGAFAP